MKRVSSVDGDLDANVVNKVKPRLSLSGWIDKMRGKSLTDDGSALVPDGVPMAPPIGYSRQVPLHEQIRAMVRSEALRAAAEKDGMETFDEADDFDVEDDPLPASPYEVPSDLEPVSSLQERSKEAEADTGHRPAPASPAAEPVPDQAAQAAGAPSTVHST